MNKQFVFVYGSLMKDFWNQDLLSKSEFLGKATTHQNMKMISMGAFPALIPTNKQNTIFGEVYCVDSQTMTNLDHLEGFPKFYNRKKVIVNTSQGEVEAWVYFIDNDRYLFGREEVVYNCWRTHCFEQDWKEADQCDEYDDYDEYDECEY